MSAEELSPAALSEIVGRFAGQRIVVVGDVCLDEYLVGQARRLSREAPVPVLEFERRFTVPGAAANPALNLKALGAEPVLIGVIGGDAEGAALCEAIESRGLRSDGLIVAHDRGTILKTRVLAEVSLLFPQQLVRIDRHDRSALDAASAAAVARRLESALAGARAALFSDYRSGVITPALVAHAVERCPRTAWLTADSQGDLGKFGRFGLVKANQQEMEDHVRHGLLTDADFEAAGRDVTAAAGIGAMLITRGGEGMSLVPRAGTAWHVPAVNRSEVFDTTGAGDTVIAVATLALVCGATLLQAAHLANVAAGIVVRRIGNALPTVEELIEWLPRIQTAIER